jgi:hypothetical protein
MPGTVSATVEGVIALDTMTDYLAAAVETLRSQRVDRALKAIESMCLSVQDHFEGLVIDIATDIAFRHDRPLGSASRSVSRE